MSVVTLVRRLVGRLVPGRSTSRRRPAAGPQAVLVRAPCPRCGPREVPVDAATLEVTAADLVCDLVCPSCGGPVRVDLTRDQAVLLLSGGVGTGELPAAGGSAAEPVLPPQRGSAP